mgnify:CR=1 FL=1
MNNSIVKAENLSHRYTIQWAIRNINLEIDQKGVYGLLGANGSGKSTIMNIICGILKQSDGNVYISGISVDRNPVEAKKHIGFLPQSAPLHPDLTVQEYLTYAAGLRLMPDKAVSKAVDKAMERCDIRHFRKRLIRNLSGGYKQRVGIAQAIVHDPEFIVLDEPTNGLDPNQILGVRKLIKEIAEEHTVLLSTHILQEVQATCEHIWMINEGSMVFSGTIEEFDNYLIPSSLTVVLMSPPTIEELKQIRGVENVMSINHNSFRIYFKDADEAIEEIVKKSVENEWHLRDIRIEKNSMDSVFAELSKKSEN